MNFCNFLKISRLLNLFYAGLFPDQKSEIPIHISSLKSEILFPNFDKCQYLKLLTRWGWYHPDYIEGLKKEVGVLVLHLHKQLSNIYVCNVRCFILVVRKSYENL